MDLSEAATPSLTSDENLFLREIIDSHNKNDRVKRQQNYNTNTNTNNINNIAPLYSQFENNYPNQLSTDSSNLYQQDLNNIYRNNIYRNQFFQPSMYNRRKNEKPRIRVSVDTDKRNNIPLLERENNAKKRQLFDTAPLVNFSVKQKAKQSDQNTHNKREIKKQNELILVPNMAENHFGVRTNSMDEAYETVKRNQIHVMKKRQLMNINDYNGEPPVVRATVNGKKADKNPILQLLRSAAGSKTQKILGLNSKAFDIFAGPLPSENSGVNTNLGQVSNEAPTSQYSTSVDQQIFRNLHHGHPATQQRPHFNSASQSVESSSANTQQFFRPRSTGSVGGAIRQEQSAPFQNQHPVEMNQPNRMRSFGTTGSENGYHKTRPGPQLQSRNSMFQPIQQFNQRPRFFQQPQHQQQRRPFQQGFRQTQFNGHINHIGSLRNNVLPQARMQRINLQPFNNMQSSSVQPANIQSSNFQPSNLIQSSNFQPSNNLQSPNFQPPNNMQSSNFQPSNFQMPQMQYPQDNNLVPVEAESQMMPMSLPSSLPFPPAQFMKQPQQSSIPRELMQEPPPNFQDISSRLPQINQGANLVMQEMRREQDAEMQQQLNEASNLRQKEEAQELQQQVLAQQINQEQETQQRELSEFQKLKSLTQNMQDPDPANPVSRQELPSIPFLSNNIVQFPNTKDQIDDSQPIELLPNEIPVQPASNLQPNPLQFSLPQTLRPVQQKFHRRGPLAGGIPTPLAADENDEDDDDKPEVHVHIQTEKSHIAKPTNDTTKAEKLHFTNPSNTTMETEKLQISNFSNSTRRVENLHISNPSNKTIETGNLHISAPTNTTIVPGNS